MREDLTNADLFDLDLILGLVDYQNRLSYESGGSYDRVDSRL